MPSKDMERQRHLALSQTGLSPNDVADINLKFDYLQEREEQRIREMCIADEESLADHISGHEERASEHIKERLMPRLAAAKERRLSAKELAQLREDIAAFIQVYEGSGERNKGLLHSLEGSRAKVEEIKEDPGAYADRLYQKFPALRDGRYRIDKKDRIAMKPRHPLT